jgi:arylformamidase
VIKSDKNSGPQWLDRMYNNRALVPDHAQHLARWASESQSARRSAPCQLDIRYGPAPGETLDVFPASGFGAVSSKSANSRKALKETKGAPVLVFIHGGYWRSLDKADHSFIAPAFTQAGACVVVPNYDLCPDVSIAQITMQMVAALAWTWRHIAEYGGDPSRVTVVGHSAGGQLAAMLLTCMWPTYASDLPSGWLKSALSVSGLYDLEPLRHTPFLKDALQLTMSQALQASPAWLPRPESGRLYSVAGAAESSEFLRQNLLIQQAWGRKSVPVCEALPGLNHFSVLQALVDPAHRLHQLALELLGLRSKP